MPNDVDKSLLDRLQALRGASEPPETPSTSSKINVDLIERSKTPTREDTLAARLKSLRSQDDASPKLTSRPAPISEKKGADTGVSDDKPVMQSIKADEEKDVESAFQTDDQTLEELLGDVGAEDIFTVEPDDDKVRALLEQLSDAIPKDDSKEKKEDDDESKEKDTDDSDGEEMQNEVDSVIARFRDEIEIEKRNHNHNDEKDEDDSPPPSEPDNNDDQQPPPDLALPSVPSGTTFSTTNPSSMDDITARLSALRTSSPSLALPSVPTSKPAKEPNRLKSRTNYADDDVDSWCTVCLEDATLLCLGCADVSEGKDGDPYCARCWKEMHVGPAAAFDDRTHKAVHFTKAKKGGKEKKVALAA